MTAPNTVNDLLESGETLFTVSYAFGLPGGRDSGSGTWIFAATGDDPNGDLDAALSEWLHGLREEHSSGNGGDYDFGVLPNWGDVMLWIGDDVLARHHLRRIPMMPTATRHVDHDHSWPID